MRKNHRRAVYYSICLFIAVFITPFYLCYLLGTCAEWINDKVLEPTSDWLKTKLRVYDTDPE